MMTHSTAARPPALRLALALLAGGIVSSVALTATPAMAHTGHRTGTYHRERMVRRHASGGMHEQSGVASVYAPRFGGRKMADGGRFSVNSDSAASRTLPLGTIVLVTNLENGRHCRVHVRDRGPFSGHRLLDLSPASAQSIGMDRHHPGLLHVAMRTLSFPAIH
jgi:rare lipoprotein A